MRKFLLFVLLSFTAPLTWSQTTTTTNIHKGKKLVWNAKSIKVEAKDPQTKVVSTREILERGTLRSYDGTDVSYKVPKPIAKRLKKDASKAVRSVESPRFNGRDLTIHLSNYVINKEGRLAYYEILLFPYKQTMQLYPNEYTEEIRQYLKKVDEALSNIKGYGAQEGPVFSSEAIIL